MKKRIISVLLVATLIMSCFTTVAFGAGNFSRLAFKASLKGTKISKHKSGYNYVKVSWKKKRGVSGYQVRYSKDAEFENSRTVTFKGKKKTSGKVKGLTQGSKYYFQIRTYKTKGKSKAKKYSAWSASKKIKTKSAPYRSMVNPTGYEEAPEAPTQIKVGSRYAGYDENYEQSSFGQLKETKLWYKNSAKGKKHIVATLKDTEKNNGEYITERTSFYLGVTDGRNFYYIKEEKNDDTESSTMAIIKVSDKGEKETVYTRNNGDVESYEDYRIIGCYANKLILDYACYAGDDAESGSDTLSLDLKTKAVTTLDKRLIDDYYAVQGNGRYILLGKQQDYMSIGDSINARYLYDIKTKTLKKLPVNKSNIAYLAPDGIYSYQVPDKRPYKVKDCFIQKMNYKGKNKKTILKGYDFCYLADDHALVDKNGKYYTFTYKSKKLKLTKKYDDREV